MLKARAWQTWYECQASECSATSATAASRLRSCDNPGVQKHRVDAGRDAIGVYHTDHVVIASRLVLLARLIPRRVRGSLGDREPKA